MRMLCKTNHLCLSSPLIGESLQVPGVICAAQCGVSILALARPPGDTLFSARVSRGETPAVRAGFQSKDASVMPLSGMCC